MKDRLRRFVVEEILNRPELALADDDDLLMSGLVDSVGIISLVDFIEEATGIDIPAQDVTLENFTSLDTIDAYVNGRAAS